ncbi:hypothetical protein GXW78_16885 [Roseomonas terrae]|uniref:Uncharacterized protein n=1 Tax=Neoroseomonas terrae TaxID=424799 RepID=A0ABS5EJZ5_9PROT|nr:hypothetical protein [Neoroseomonas terrae]MBR0651351.1 hypothetical protein [Neoroseomonas terrae]
MIRYFLRENDPLCPVYAVDFEAKTWELAASRLGRIEGSGGSLADRDDVFLSERFAEVWPKPHDKAGIVAFTRDRPAEAPEAK